MTRVVYLVEASNPRSIIPIWTTIACGSKKIADDERDRLSKVYKENDYRVRPMEFLQQRRRRV